MDEQYLRYIWVMFDVLTFVYENYDAGDTCQEPALLERRLKGVGFDAQEVEEALAWLQGMDQASHAEPLQTWLKQPQRHSMRVYPAYERIHLGVQAVGFISFLDAAGALPAHIREVVIDRAMATPNGPVALDDLKIIVLLVCWRFGHELDTLVLDELCDSGTTPRVVH